MANGPKRFDETTTSTSALLKDSTEYIGIAQSGTSKKILTSDLMTAANVGLDQVDNTADADKIISDATQTALDLKADSTDVDNALDLKADSTDLTSHTSDTDNPHSVTKAQVGLGNVIDTSDMDKPVSTAQQEALDDKVAITDIYDGLDSTSTDVPLSANAGNKLSVEKADLDSVPTFNGIQFPSTQVASSDVNTLDDYEEGTWTPAFYINGVYEDSIHIGKYTKIGNLVTVQGYGEFTKSGDNSGAVTIQGLPYGTSSYIYNFQQQLFGASNITTTIYAYFGSNQNTINLYKHQPVNNPLLDTDLTTKLSTYFQVTYFTD